MRKSGIVPLSLLLAASLAAVSCGVRVPQVPPAARGQVPHAAPTGPWFAQGRMELVLPGKRVSCTALVRGLGDGRARLALMSDEGLQLADLTSTADGYEVNQALDDLKKALPALGRMLRQAYALPAEQGHRQWCNGRLAGLSGKDTRWFGGDPVLLRSVQGDGLDIAIEDYRPLSASTPGSGELLAREVRANGPFGITIRIHLGQAKVMESKRAPDAKASPPSAQPSSPAPAAPATATVPGTAADF